MRYEKIITKIRCGEMSRIDLLSLRCNATQKMASGDADAAAVISARRCIAARPQLHLQTKMHPSRGQYDEFIQPSR